MKVNGHWNGPSMEWTSQVKRDKVKITFDFIVGIVKFLEIIAPKRQYIKRLLLLNKRIPFESCQVTERSLTLWACPNESI